MVITKELLDRLSEKAKASERLRVNMDLRNTPEDNSQRKVDGYLLVWRYGPYTEA